ncbi:MAG TPA: acyl-CoA dehydrogenase family protein [Kineosporiaceae bacterium]
MPVNFRWNDYSLTDEQRDLATMLGGFFRDVAPVEVVRAAEPLGYDDDLWKRTIGAGIPRLALPDSAGGDGAGLIELALAAAEAGRTLAPIPFVDASAATRLLAMAGPDHADLPAAVEGSLVCSLAPLSGRRGGPQLTPSGAVAGRVLLLLNGDLVLLSRDAPPAHAANQGSAPLAWWDPADPDTRSEVLATGPRARTFWDHAVGEWQIATAAALGGLAGEACRLTRTYALQRYSFGVPIASHQAVSHTLVDMHMAAQTTRNLALKAAWYSDNEPATRPELPAMALADACRTALRNTERAVHLHGGFGITSEADISLYHRRAAVWGQLGGGSTVHLQTIAAAVDRLLAAGHAD